MNEIDPDVAAVMQIVKTLGSAYDDMNDALLKACDEIAVLREALEAMVDEQVDYMRINQLGDAEDRQTIKAARSALAATNPWSADLGTAPLGELFWCFQPHEQGGFMFAGFRKIDGSWGNNLDGREQHPTHYRRLPAVPQLVHP